MAEMVVKESGKKGPGVKKSKKKSTTVDLTPMVDLGFLLITFFIFTTTMDQPTSMNLNMPKDVQDQKDEMLVKETGSLTLMLGKGDIIYYYYGQDPATMETTGYKSVRDIILKKKRETPADDFFVTIKPDDDATYKNAVDILDEMNINDVSKYAMIPPTPEEYQMIKQTEKAAGIE